VFLFDVDFGKNEQGLFLVGQIWLQKMQFSWAEALVRKG